MRNLLFVCVTILIPTFVGGGGDPETAMKDYIKAIAEMNKILKTVKDAKSAEAAVTLLDAPTNKMLDLGAELKPILDKKNANVMAKLEPLVKDLLDVATVLGAEYDRLYKQPELFKTLLKGKAWTRFDNHIWKDNIERAKLDLKALELAQLYYAIKRQFWGGSLDELLLRFDGKPPLMSEKELIDPWGGFYRVDNEAIHVTSLRPLIWSKGPHSWDANSRIARWDSKDKLKVDWKAPKAAGITSVKGEAAPAIKDATKAVKDLETILKAVKDKKSAIAAVPKLDGPTQRLHAALRIIEDSVEGRIVPSLKNPIYDKALDDAFAGFDEAAIKIIWDPEMRKTVLECQIWDARLSNAVWGCYVQQRQVEKAKTQIKDLESVVIAIKMKTGDWPESVFDLVPKEARIDPWGNGIWYDPSQVSNGIPLIYSEGPPYMPLRIYNWEPAK